MVELILVTVRQESATAMLRGSLVLLVIRKYIVLPDVGLKFERGEMQMMCGGSMKRQKD